MFDAAVDLSNNLNGLSLLVVKGEEEDRPVHHARDLVMESAEEPGEITSVRTKRSQSTRDFKLLAKLLVYGQRTRHVPTAVAPRMWFRAINSLLIECCPFRGHGRLLARMPCRVGARCLLSPREQRSCDIALAWSAGLGEPRRTDGQPRRRPLAQ